MPLRYSLKEKFRRALQKIRLITQTLKTFDSDYMEFGIKTYDDLKNIDLSIVEYKLNSILENETSKKGYSSIRKVCAEELEKSKAKWYILDPNSKIRGIWEFILLFNLLYILYTIPRDFVFSTTDSLVSTIIENWIQVCFILDMFLQSFTYYIEDGIQIYDIKKIRNHYLKTNFTFDFVCAFPLSWIFLAINASSNTSISSAKQVLRLFRILNIPKRLRILFIKFNINPIVVKLLLTFLSLFFYIHLVSCGYWFISTMEYGGLVDCPNETNIQCWNNYCLCDSTQTVPYILNSTYQSWYSQGNPDLWVPTPYSSLYNSATQEIISFYWAITAVTGVGMNITPKTYIEYTYSTAVILIGVIFYAVIIANITNIIQTYNVEDNERAGELDRLHNYLKKNNVPPHYYDSITTHIEEQWKNEDPDLSKDITHLVPSNNMYNLKKMIWKRLVYKCPMLSLVDIYSYYSIVSTLEKRVYITGDFICRRNECGDEMFLSYYGKVDAVAMDDVTVYYSIYPGDHFGEQCLMSSGIVRRECSFRACTNAHVYVLKRAVYNDIILKSPELYYFIKSINESRVKIMKPVAVRNNVQVVSLTKTSAKLDDSTSNKIFRLGTTKYATRDINKELILRPTLVYDDVKEASEMLFGRSNTKN